MRNGIFDINKNHHVHFGDQYLAMPLVSGHRPMVVEFLEVLHGVVCKALNQYPRVAGFRFDLHFPSDMTADPQEQGNSEVSRFVDSLKAKIEHNRMKAAKNKPFVHNTVVRHFWVREVGDWGRVHYHFVLLLNAYAFNWLGSYEANGRNLASRICEAWASALRRNVDDVKTLVHFPDNPTYELRRDEPSSVEAFMQRASYLCKALTKQYGYGHHGYGASRH